MESGSSRTPVLAAALFALATAGGCGEPKETQSSEDCGTALADCRTAASEGYSTTLQVCEESDTGDTGVDCMDVAAGVRDAASKACDDDYQTCEKK